jgi:CRP-like cAMP-binding protein
MSDAEVVDRLDRIIKLLILGMTSEKPQIERIRLLASVGFQPKDIAETLGTTRNTVNVALAGLREKQALKRSSEKGRARGKRKTKAVRGR